jgi:diguanylate cyclase (GGDEF)-like protein
MKTRSQRAAPNIADICAAVLVGMLAVLVVGLLAVHLADSSARSIATDELRTNAVTGQVGTALDAAVLSADQVVDATGAQRAAVAAQLVNRDIPAVDAATEELLDAHANDNAAERADLARFVARWHRLRAVLNTLVDPATDSRTTAAAVRARFGALSSQTADLVAREQRDGETKSAHTSSVADNATWLLVFVFAAGLGLVAWAAARATRRLRRLLEPAQEQVGFADDLQLAQDEEEAHLLLQRHVERTVPGSSAVVLNRNNSADRLEPKTVLPDGSPLATTLAEASPRSCLAVRSARVYRSDEDHAPLLECGVCGPCDGSVLCHPLTVGGEVIGSVLVNRDRKVDQLEENRVRDSVLQAAPVMANLRNLAIAEMRAATDSLTGLPNKRAVGDTIKQLVADATRSRTTLSLLCLDLDHFKDINDRHGHAAGDITLAGVGAAMRSALRDRDFAGRSGGEEFVILLPDTDVDGAIQAAEGIRASISEVRVPNDDRTLTASVGVATFPAHATTPERLERLADAALYVAKRSGRDRTEVAMPPDPQPHPGEMVEAGS